MGGFRGGTLLQGSSAVPYPVVKSKVLVAANVSDEAARIAAVLQK
jgi:hypothetical protein